MDYRFLGAELVGLMEGWIVEERQGVLNTEPPPSPLYPEVENVGTAAGTVPPNEAPEKAPLTHVEE